MAAKLDKPMSSPALKVFFDKKYTPEEKDEHTQDVKKPTTEGYMKILQIVYVSCNFRIHIMLFIS